jgi:chemotaxis methyl-accepting protein methylase
MKNRPITELLLKTHSVDISKFDETFLEKIIRKRITETLCNSEETYCALLEQNEKEATVLFDSLFISYSEFFRNSLTFSVLEKIILPTLIAKKTKTKRKEIRIWSAACATGQETYSLAMLLKEYQNGDDEKINFRIFATDYCESEVNDAKKGEYNIEALNNLCLKRINQWFTKKGD